MKVLRPLCFDETRLTLAAVDEDDLLVRVDLATWEQMPASGSDWMDSEDRRDHALSSVEMRAARIVPVTSHQGRLVTIR